MNRLEIYHVMMKELYDISVFFLRCLRDLEKWSWIEKIGKNEEKWGKIAAPESPNIHYSCTLYRHSVLNLFLNKPIFMWLQYKSFENTVEKGEIACKKHFLLFPQCFLPFYSKMFNTFFQI